MGAGGEWWRGNPPPHTAGGQAKIRQGVSGGNGIGGPRRRKIGRIGGQKVDRRSGGKVKLFIPTVYKRIFMNFMVKIDEIYIGLTLFSTVFLQKSLIYIDFDRGSGR